MWIFRVHLVSGNLFKFWTGKKWTISVYNLNKLENCRQIKFFDLLMPIGNDDKWTLIDICML